MVCITSNHNYNHLRISRLNSIILLILRKLSFQKITDISDADNITITVGELHDEIESTGLFEKRILKKDLMEAYRFLAKYNICEKIGELENDDTVLIIYPTINYILSYSVIDEIERRIQNYKESGKYEDFDECEID